MNPLRALIETVTDRIHADGDDAARAAGLTVERLPGGRRRVGHPQMAAWADARRERAVRDGLDPVDLALIDPATRLLLAEAAARVAARHPAAARPAATAVRA